MAMINSKILVAPSTLAFLRLTANKTNTVLLFVQDSILFNAYPKLGHKRSVFAAIPARIVVAIG